MRKLLEYFGYLAPTLLLAYSLILHLDGFIDYGREIKDIGVGIDSGATSQAMLRFSKAYLAAAIAGAPPTASKIKAIAQSINAGLKSATIDEQEALPTVPQQAKSSEKKKEQRSASAVPQTQLETPQLKIPEIASPPTTPDHTEPTPTEQAVESASGEFVCGANDSRIDCSALRRFFLDNGVVFDGHELTVQILPRVRWYAEYTARRGLPFKGKIIGFCAGWPSKHFDVKYLYIGLMEEAFDSLSARDKDDMIAHEAYHALYYWIYGLDHQRPANRRNDHQMMCGKNFCGIGEGLSRKAAKKYDFYR